ncbi:hypothetical protein pKMKP103_CDS0081 [Klebsiella phage pKMKP103]|nr:hypothetical protein pKMKP103_CDS0081 [Klebsiella phage pKMKP103]
MTFFKYCVTCARFLSIVENPIRLAALLFDII